MGIRDDIQIELANAFDTDLADATRIIQFISTVDIYNEDTMTNSSIETNIDVRAVKLIDEEGENLDKPSLSNSVKFLVLSNEIGLATYTIGTKIIDGSDQYKIEGNSKDPVEATFEFTCRRWS